MQELQLVLYRDVRRVHCATQLSLIVIIAVDYSANNYDAR